MHEAVLVEVMKNRFQAIVDEMGTVILKTGHTVFVKETADFGAALVSPEGEVFAVPNAIGVASMVGRPMRDVLAGLEVVQEGDVFIANDPETTYGLSTHLNDIFVWKPIFHAGQVVCYGLTFLHASDVGGRVPGSISPSSTDIFQEGSILPPMRLVRQGQLQREVVNLIRANSRIPDQNWGDIKALLAAVNVVEERVRALIQKNGVEVFTRGIQGVLDYAEQQARALIEQIPDGAYTFGDYMEGIAGEEGPIYIRLTLRVAGADLTLDFTGTDSQVMSAFNLPSHSQRGHWCLVRGLVDYFRTVTKDIAHNSGLVRPVNVIAPKGSLLNPYATAACGVRAATILRVYDCTMAALAQAVGERIPACGSGQASILLVSVPELYGGGMRVSVVQPLTGGSGGRPFKDGVDGADTASGYLRNVPVEAIEHELPILIRRYGLRPDSGGPGQFRGGTGIVLEFELLAPKAIVTARGLERYRFHPWGLFGGEPGRTGYTLLNPGRPDEKELGRFDVLELYKGDVLRLGTPGGGGWGAPLKRDPIRVQTDMQRGLVSPAAAQEDYGVVFQGDEVDLAATRQQRQQAAAAGGSIFSLGEARKDYEQAWPESMRQALHEVLGQFSGTVRQLASQRLRDRLKTLRETHGAPSAQTVRQAAQAIVAELMT